MSTPLSHRDQLVELHRLMREAVKETQKLDATWNRLNDEVNTYLDDQGVRDIVQRTHIKSASIPLKDALEAGRWWREKAVYLATVIQAEIAIKEALS
jgi:hypothetical protein